MGRPVRAGKVTGPEGNTRGGFWFPAPEPRSGRPPTLTGDCTAGSPCWSGPPAAAASPVYHPVVGTPYGGTQGGHRRPAR